MRREGVARARWHARAKATWVVALGLALVASSASAGLDNTIAVDTLVPYADKDEIRASIREECGLGSRLSRYVVRAAEARGLTLERVGVLADAKQQRVLSLRITDALSAGRGFVPAMTISIDGILKEEGKVIGTFEATRFAKASFIPFVWTDCKVLSRGVKLLAEDVAKWLEKPVMDSRLGDAR